MKKIGILGLFVFISSIIFTVAFANAGGSSSADGVVERAIDKAQAGKFEKFKETLSEGALKDFGTLEGMAQVKSHFNGVKDVNVETEILNVQYDRQGRPSVKTYSAQAFAKANKNTSLMDAAVACKYTYVDLPGWGCGGGWGGLPGHNRCWPPSGNLPYCCYSHETWSTNCSISWMKLIN